MATEMGEYLVGAYLKLVLKCNVVDYNVRTPDGGLEGLGEIDVVGFDFENHIAYFCEVTTHLDGLLIGGGAQSTMERLSAKHERQRNYARQHLHLKNFATRFMFWSPRVRPGLATLLGESGFELFINETYTHAIDELRDKARTSTADKNNPAFRILQILEHLRRGNRIGL